MLIPDALLELMADEFVLLRLDLDGITLEQFITAPQRCREVAALRRLRATAQRTGSADEPMRHTRHLRNRVKSDFSRRVI